MVSIRKLEKMLRPYEWYGGFSSQYTEFWTYEKGDVNVRIDEIDMPPFGNKSYKELLYNAALKLRLIPD